MNDDKMMFLESAVRLWPGLDIIQQRRGKSGFSL